MLKKINMGNPEVKKVEKPINKPEIKVEVPNAVKAPVVEKAKENLSESSENLFPKKSLDNIWISVSEAQILARDVLWVPKIELPWTKELIKEFQKKNEIKPEDGKVWAETYKKMLEISEKSISLVKKAENKFDEFGLTNSTLGEISELIPKMMLRSKQYQILTSLVAKFKTCKKFEKDAKSRELLRKITGTYEEDKKTLEKSEDTQSFYQTIKDPNLSPKEKFEKIIKDPTLLMVGGLLFLFGVIWDDTEYTNSFMKRIWWIMGIWLFWKAAWNKLGLWELVDDAEKLWSKIKDNITKAAENSKPKIDTFFKEDLKKIFKNVKDYNFSELWDNIKWWISDNYTKLTNWFASYNENFKWKDWKPNKEWYIEEKPLIALSWLMSDEKFLNTSKKDLLNISGSLNWIVTQKSQKKLNDAWVSPEDINFFIKKHLLGNAFTKEKDAVLVRDLLFTTSAYDKLKQKIVNNWEYVKDNKLNSDINSLILSLVNSSNKQKVNLWLSLAMAIKSWKIEDFKLDNFVWIVDKNSIEKILKNVKEYEEAKTYVENKIHDIENIKLSLNNKITKTAWVWIVSWVLAEIYDVNLDEYKTYWFIFPKFEEVKNNKINDILKKAIAYWLWNKKFIISKWPYSSEKKTANEYLENIKKDLEQKEKEKVQENLKEFNSEITKLNERLGKVTNTMIYSKAQIELKSIENEYKKLWGWDFNKYLKETKNIVFTTINDLFWKNIINNKIWTPEEKEKSKKLNKFVIELAKKYIDIENAFSTNINFDVNNLGDYTFKIKDRYDDLDNFRNDEIKKIKKSELIKSFNDNFNKTFTDKIKNENDLPKLEKIYSDYNILTSNLDDKFIGENVKKEYEKKVRLLKEKELLKLWNNDEKVNKIIKDSWVIDFFDKNTDIWKEVLNNKKLKLMWDAFNDNTPLKDIISFFIDVNSKINPYKITKEIKKESEKVLKALSHNIDIEIDWYLKATFNQITN